MVKNKFNTCVLREFGHTDYCPIGGWLMPDGEMLDLSGGENDGVRYRDHREIEICLPKHLNRLEVLDYMQKEIGAVRMSMFRNKNYFDPHVRGNHHFNIQLHKEQNITDEQWKTLKQCAKQFRANPIYYDIYDDNFPIHLPELKQLSDNPKGKVEILEEMYNLIKKGYTSGDIFAELFGEEYR